MQASADQGREAVLQALRAAVRDRDRRHVRSDRAPAGRPLRPLLSRRVAGPVGAGAVRRAPARSAPPRQRVHRRRQRRVESPRPRQRRQATGPRRRRARSRLPPQHHSLRSDRGRGRLRREGGAGAGCARRHGGSTSPSTPRRTVARSPGSTGTITRRARSSTTRRPAIPRPTVAASRLASHPPPASLRNGGDCPTRHAGWPAATSMPTCGPDVRG